MNKGQLKTAMILAAGKGERMLPLTLATPKPLLTVKGVPLIEHHIVHLKAMGIERLVVNIAYLGEKIRRYLGDGSRYGVRIVYSIEPEPLETAGAIYHALEHIGQAPFLLVNADIWAPDGYTCVPALPIGAMGLLGMVANPAHNLDGDFCLAPDGSLNLPVKTDASTRNACETSTYMGLAVLDPKIVTSYPSKRARFALKEVFDWAITNGHLFGFEYTKEWVDVGTPERLEELNKQP